MSRMMELKLIIDFIQQIHGINLLTYNESFLEKSIEARMKQVNCSTPGEYYAFLQQDFSEGKELEETLQIHYSEFFRNPLTFALLERIVIPEIIQRNKLNARKEIRIWSAGCAAGQEAYSMAILLEEWNNNCEEKIKYRIFATDLDEKLLDEARAGCYPAAALRNVSLSRTQAWFMQTNGRYKIKPEIQQNIDFSVFDLLNHNHNCPPPSVFGDFDLVFCCNVLFYYQSEFQNLILEKLEHCISSEGYLVTSETERSIILDNHFHEAYPQAAIFHTNHARINSQ